MFKSITSKDKELINDFLCKSSLSQQSFRYFKNREIKSLDNHIYTVLLYTGKDIVGYGHLDYDTPNNIIWLGICVCDQYHNQGNGNKIISHLTEYLDEHHNNSQLSVDKDNNVALRLYNKFGFKIVNDMENNYIMKRIYNAR